MKKKKESPLGWTSLEQSKKLEKLGLDPETADMYYSAYVVDAMGRPYKKKEFHVVSHPWTERSSMVVGHSKVEYVPCWSAGKLYEMLPNAIVSDDDDVIWHKEVIGTDIFYFSANDCCQCFGYNSLVASSFEMMKWVLGKDFKQKYKVK